MKSPTKRKDRAAAHAELIEAVGDNAASDVLKTPLPELELWTAETTCAFFGGDKPLNVATLYRGVAAGRFPRPINISSNLVRWIASECRVALAEIIERRNAGERTTPRNGGRRATIAA